MAELPKSMTFGPQPGPQTEFLRTKADIAIYGGSAGSGKSYGLLLEPLRHYANRRFGALFLRRTSVQIRNPGGLWDESMTIYPYFSARPRESALQWIFPRGPEFKFAHLEHEYSVYNWQGAQIPYIAFDELTHFSSKQFFYMMSRNRSISGVPGYIRATTNPDPNSWVRQFIDWWIGPDGFPIKERSGVVRYFVRIKDNMIWGSSPEEIWAIYGKTVEIQPKSVTFISAKLHDNKILMEKDPAYLSNLLALSWVERQRLLDGNWNVKEGAGTMFRREWFPIVDAVPGGWTQAVRFWDRAATKPNPANADPDWTRGLKVFQYPDGIYYVVDLRSARDTPGQIESLIKNVASHDSQAVRILSQQDPGSAGVGEGEHFIRMLSGYDVHVETLTKDKLTRARPVSAQCEAGNLRVVRGPWNNDFFDELENFPEGSHDDIVDTLSGAFNALSREGMSLADALWRGR